MHIFQLIGFQLFLFFHLNLSFKLRISEHNQLANLKGLTPPFRAEPETTNNNRALALTLNSYFRKNPRLIAEIFFSYDALSPHPCMHLSYAGLFRLKKLQHTRQPIQILMVTGIVYQSKTPIRFYQLHGFRYTHNRIKC